jgi:predicted CXXCH cytochrome family protein
MPALADGGPHVKGLNNGTGAGGLTADTCAGCHRAHTAQNDKLLIKSSITELCLSCHGGGATGATTNVVNGVQFKPASASDQLHRDAGVILGALRGGGFATAAIGSSSAYKAIGAFNTSSGHFASIAKVPVQQSGSAITGASVTSAHMIVPNSPLATGFFTGTVWGNLTTSPGDNVVGATGGTLECTSCHNPHGNGNYRILRGAAVDLPTIDGGSDFTAGTYSAVTDALLPPSDSSTGTFTDTRNYTVIQTAGGTGTLLASQISGTYTNLAGDYLHKTVPWNAYSGGTADAPNGQPLTYNAQINAWCVTCHTRYLSGGSADLTNANAIFHNRHYAANSTRAPVCTTCHVAHGTNAVMTPGGYSASVPYPGGAAAPPGDSRLLKVNNRGICQTCHDPTGTLGTGDSVGPLPTPYAP